MPTSDDSCYPPTLSTQTSVPQPQQLVPTYATQHHDTFLSTHVLSSQHSTHDYVAAKSHSTITNHVLQ